MHILWTLLSAVPWKARQVFRWCLGRLSYALLNRLKSCPPGFAWEFSVRETTFRFENWLRNFWISLWLVRARAVGSRYNLMHRTKEYLSLGSSKHKGDILWQVFITYNHHEWWMLDIEYNPFPYIEVLYHYKNHPMIIPKPIILVEYIPVPFSTQCLLR